MKIKRRFGAGKEEGKKDGDKNTTNDAAKPTGSLFGETKPTNESGKFKLNQPLGGTSLFGNTTTTSTSSPFKFGDANGSANNGKSLFGGENKSSSLFGNSNGAGGSLFGNPPSGGSLFGQNAGGETKSSSLFGNTGNSLFGNGGSSLFGAKPTGSLFNANNSLFGKPQETKKDDGEDNQKEEGSQDTGNGGNSPPTFTDKQGVEL